MRIVVFDTETTSIEKPFVYDIGYTIYDTEERTVLLERSFVVEQVWHNRELFSTAYYAEKREGYISRMKGRTAFLEKIGYITQQMARDFSAFEVVAGYAYNSPFDDGVFQFNCEWFKIINPFDILSIFDIRGYVHNKIAFTPEYKRFCEENSLFTESGNYSTTAESVYRFLTKDTNFAEAHTALEDARIELEILRFCVEHCGAEWNTEYKVYRSIRRKGEKTLVIKDTEGYSTILTADDIVIRQYPKDKKVAIYLK